MTLTLRSYQPEDFELLYALDQACYPRGIAYSRRTLRWFLAQRGTDCLLAHTAEPASVQLAGFILTEAEGAEAHVITIDVDERYRRAGAGSALLTEIEGRLSARGVEQISLETATNNDAAVAFWKRHGYFAVGVLPRYYLNRLDAFFMQKRLCSA
jgi:[ribosomal protein S18]-alanine N-acetyltransferase